MGRFSKRKPTSQARRWPLPVGAFLGGSLLASLGWVLASKPDPTGPNAPDIRSAGHAIEDWLRSQPAGLEPDTDIGMLNLACSLDLGGSAGNLEMAAALATLDDWARIIARETFRNHHRYCENPSEFGSEPAWKLAMMCSVLGQDLRVRYDHELSQKSAQNAPDAVFYADPSKVFLTGLLGKDRVGTCASLPVLYVALGRRVGYPLHLVSAKGHLFVRWDDGKGTRLNMEAANAGGYISHPDNHYRTWPFPITADEERGQGYLTNLEPARILSVFLANRALCLQSAGKRQEAVRAAWQAYSLAPNLGGNPVLVSRMLPAEIAWPFRRRTVMPVGPPDPDPLLPVPGIHPVPVNGPHFGTAAHLPPAFDPTRNLHTP